MTRCVHTIIIFPSILVPQLIRVLKRRIGSHIHICWEKWIPPRLTADIESTLHPSEEKTTNCSTKWNILISLLEKYKTSGIKMIETHRFEVFFFIFFLKNCYFLQQHWNNTLVYIRWRECWSNSCLSFFFKLSKRYAGGRRSTKVGV